MIIHHLNFKNFTIELYLKNSNFYLISAKTVILELVGLICLEAREFEEFCRPQRSLFLKMENERILVNFSETLKVSKNKLLKIRIIQKISSGDLCSNDAKRAVESQNVPLRGIFRYLKSQLPTIFDERKIRDLNFRRYLKTEYSSMISDCLDEIIVNRELKNEIMQKNGLLNENIKTHSDSDIFPVSTSEEEGDRAS